jgi:molybdopterin-binding protein
VNRYMSLSAAADAIGVSVNTLRRWDRLGKLRTRRDSHNHRLVSHAEVQRLTTRPGRHETSSGSSARNRFPGVVRSVEANGVMARVEIEASGLQLVALITRDSVDELGLVPGLPVAAVVKATAMMVDLEQS